MNLKAYLCLQGISMKDFAKKIGYNPRYLSRLANLELHPGNGLRELITEMSNGQVSFKDKPKKQGEKEMRKDPKMYMGKLTDSLRWCNPTSLDDKPAKGNKDA